MALVENAEQQADRVAMELSRSGVKATWSATGAMLSKGSGSARAALAHFQDAFRQAVQKRLTTGQVSLATFAGQTGGAREVLNIESRSVARELTKELRRYGVTFAVDRMPNGVAYHVAGKDAQAVAHALDRAAARVDERAARNQTKRSVKQSIKERVEQKKAGRSQNAPTFKRTPRQGGGPEAPTAPRPTRGGSR